jgi:hypothetical protein
MTTTNDDLMFSFCEIHVLYLHAQVCHSHGTPHCCMMPLYMTSSTAVYLLPFAFSVDTKLSIASIHVDVLA